MHRADRWLLRVDGDQRREGEAALRHSHAGPVAVRSRGPLGELEEPCHRRVGPNLLRHHNRGKRARRAYSRPHAGDPRPEDYGRWLALDPDGPNLLQPFPSEPMAWPISTRVNSPKNDDAGLL